MDQDLFNDLPSETILNILSRLPVVTIMRCKCVCKLWLELLETREFVNCHLSKSVPALTFFERRAQPKPFKIVEFEVDLNGDERCNTVFNFDLPSHDSLGRGTVNGLVLCTRGGIPGDILICNPVTRDYIKLPSTSRSREYMYRASGFGVSKTSRQYKVVRIFQIRVDVFECQVYTVGTGSWRIIGCCGPLMNEFRYKGATFLNGNLHWLAMDCSSISCLDLETEIVSTFSTPPLHYPYKCRIFCALKDCLCLCDNSDYTYSNYENNADYEIDIWMMKEYGDEKSWTKQFIIRKEQRLAYLGGVIPIKVFEDGGILMEWICRSRIQRLYYSSKTRTIRKVDMFGLGNNTLATIYSPSFLPLESFSSFENVYSF